MATSDNWTTLIKELATFGIHLSENGTCQYYDAEGKAYQNTLGELGQEVRKSIRQNVHLFRSLWNQVANLLNRPVQRQDRAYDPKIIDLFIHNLRDLSNLCMVFDELDGSPVKNSILHALERDIKDFDPAQIKSLPDYKISIDWVLRLIHRFKYIHKLLSFAGMGQEKARNYIMKTARGVAGPWSNLDLPMEERVIPFTYDDEDLRGRMVDKLKQYRYRKGLENYNASDGVGEGHYWRELRNEPFSWYDQSENPYPHRNVLWS